MGPEVIGDKLGTIAFGVCNTDGVNGLSWTEIEQCQVCENKYDHRKSGYFALLVVKFIKPIYK